MFAVSTILGLKNDLKHKIINKSTIKFNDS